MIADEAVLRRHIAAHPIEGTPEQMRAAFACLAGATTQVPQVRVGGVPGRWFGPADGAPVLWLHGGGYVFGSSVTHSAMAGALATRLSRPIFVADYRRAPDHPWPAQLEDAIAVISALGRCDVVGDSAGGHLALNLALAVAGAVETLSLISPNTDRTGRSTTRGPNSARDAMNDDAADRRLSDLALGGLPEEDPAVSPLLADLSDLPPCFVTVATGEVLLDDATLLAVALGRAGVDVTLRVERGLFHLWPLWPHATQQAGQTLDAIARFISAPPVGHVPASMEQSVPDSRSSPEKHTQE